LSAAERASEKAHDILEVASNITVFASNLDGIDYLVVVSEGFPISSTGLPEDKAETASALAVDLAVASDLYISDLVGAPWREVLVVTGGSGGGEASSKVLGVARAQNLLVLGEGSRRVTEEVLSIAINYIEGRRVKCPYCGFDLTLQVYKCPRCSRRIPFRSRSCPFCGAYVDVKPCPSCGRLTTGRGERVAEERRGSLSLAAVEGVIGGAVLGTLLLIATGSPLAAAVGGVAGFALTALLIYRNMPKSYRVVRGASP
jgi:hypothetical protein